MSRQRRYFKARNKYAMMQRNREILEKRKETIRKSCEKGAEKRILQILKS